MQTATNVRSRMGSWAAGFFLVLCAIFTFLPWAHAANDGLIGANIKDGQLLGYYGDGGDITIPNTVTTIAPEAFKGNDNVTSVTIPGSVSTIGYNAFEGCTALKAVYFSDPVVGAKLTIRVNAFINCPQLSECTIPACAEYVTGNVFKGCTSMTAIKVHPENPHYFTDEYGVLFGPWVIEGVPQYEDPNRALLAYPCGRPAGGYTIPGSVKGHPINQVWASSFRNAKNLTSIEIPATCTILGGNAFENTSLKELTIPATVQQAGAALVAECKDLTDVTILAPLTNLDMSFFENCTSLQRVQFPKELKTLGMYAFRGCTSITNLILPDGMGAIGMSVFDGCTNLQRVFIPASVTSFPTAGEFPIDPFEEASNDLMVYVVKGSTGERWANSHADEFGWKFQVINGSQDLPTLDAGTFSLVDMGKKVKVTGAFRMGDSLMVRKVTSGSEYDAFRAAAQGEVTVYHISMANGAAVPSPMTLGIGRSSGAGTDSKLYTLKDSAVTPVPSNLVSGTITAQISELGYYAITGDNGSGGGGQADPSVPTNIQLSRSTAEVAVGQRVQLYATVTPSTAADKSVTWKSSTPTVADVSSRGEVQGLSAGTATIIATTSNGLEARCKVTVTNGATPPPKPPVPTDSITASAALRAGNSLTPQGLSPFALNLRDSSRIATVEIRFETTGTAVNVKGQNGFVLLGDVNTRTSGGKLVGSAMLCYLNGERTLFSCAGESAIAHLSVTGDKPSLKITGLTISGWNSKNQVSYGTVAGIDPSETTFTGSMAYDLTGDGLVDQLDITWAQMYYRAQSGDANWETAQRCDFNGDSLIDIADFIDILMHFDVRP